MENKIINLQVNDNLVTTENSVKSLKAQLREAQNEVNALSDKFGATSREAVQAAKQAAILKDRISDAKALTDAFNPDAKFRALTSSLSGVTGGFAALQGGMALFGSESEDVQKTLLKVQSAMALSQGIQSVGESVDSFKQLGAVIKSTSLVQGIYNFVQTGTLTAVKANTVATEAQTVATEVSAVATATASNGLKLFRLALIGTGIGALVVGVGLLISNFDKVKKVVLNLIPGLASVGEFIGGIVNSITDFVGATSDASRALDKLKKDADNTLAVNKKFMQEHGDQVDEYTKKKIEAKNTYANAIKEDGADQVALAKKLNRELGTIEFSRGDEARKIQKEAAEKAAAERKAQAKKSAADKKAAAEKENEEAKKLKEEQDKKVISDAEAFRNKLEEALKVEADAKKANADALLTEQQLAIQNENLAYQAKLDNAKRFGVSTEEIETQHLNNLNNINLTAQQKQYAEDKANADALIKIEELKTQAKIEQAQRGAALLTNISDLIGKDTAAGKVAAVAATTINTYAAAQAAFLNAQKNPISILGPAYPYISAGLAIAGGLKNVQAILSVPTPSGGGGGSAPSGGGMGSAPVAPQFNVVGASSTSQLAQTIGNQQNTPVQAFVVSNDVTTAQALDRNIIKGASL